jgi:hypothetical protein
MSERCPLLSSFWREEAIEMFSSPAVADFRAGTSARREAGEIAVGQEDERFSHRALSP